MSYDMYIGDESFNYTYNVADMWYACYPQAGIRKHYGMTGYDAIPILDYLYNFMIINESKLREMEPSNGWGSYDGALDFVNELIQASMRNLHDVWEGD